MTEQGLLLSNTCLVMIETREICFSSEEDYIPENWSNCTGSEMKTLFYNPKYLDLSEFSAVKIKHVIDFKWIENPH